MSKKVMCGDVAIGGGAPISIQSMTNVDSRDEKALVEQIARLEDAGCQIIRMAVPDMESAETFEQVKKKLVAAGNRVHADAGRVAVMRGPVVYCMEGVDNNKEIFGLRLAADAVFEEEDAGICFAETIRIGSVGLKPRSSRVSSYPSILGIIISTIISAVSGFALKSSRATSPSSASRGS